MPWAYARVGDIDVFFGTVIKSAMVGTLVVCSGIGTVPVVVCWIVYAVSHFDCFISFLYVSSILGWLNTIVRRYIGTGAIWGLVHDVGNAFAPLLRKDDENDKLKKEK